METIFIDYASVWCWTSIPVVWNLRTMNLSSVGKNLPCRGCEPLLSLFWGRIHLCVVAHLLFQSVGFNEFTLVFLSYLDGFWGGVQAPAFAWGFLPPIRIIPKYLKPVITSSLWAYWGQIPCTTSQSQVPLIPVVPQLSKQYLIAHALQGPHCLHLSLFFLSSAIPQRFR